MLTINVIDLETNKEFELISYSKTDEYCVIRNDEYGYCHQEKSKLKLYQLIKYDE